jgi:CheY-like chemotaxis protein
MGLSPPGALEVETDGLELLCECGSADCRETVRVPRGALEAFRHTDRPLLAPGHELSAAPIQDTWEVAAPAARQPPRSHKALGARVLAVDDSEIFLGVADSVVGATTWLRLVGTATSGEEALRLLPELQPDLVLLDIHMPGIDGLETSRIIRRESPQTVVVLVSAEPSGLEAAAESAGAVAILDKVDLGPELIDQLWLKNGSRD